MIKNLLINVLSRSFGAIIKILPPKVIVNNLMNFGLKIEKYNNAFFTYHIRPKKAKDISIKSNLDYNDTGIIIQGPIVEENDFTIETVKLYKKFFSKITIVVSTWDDANVKLVKQLESVGSIVILNKKPDLSGALNSNYQIISTRAGIEKLMEFKEIKYVLKTRSDQRIYNPNCLCLFRQLQKQHPPIIKEQKARIVSVNFTTLKFRPFAIGDMCMFGNIVDIGKYWDIAFDNREIVISATFDKNTKELIDMNVGESFYCKNYLNKNNIQHSNTIKDSFDVYRKYFIVIDNSIVDLFWYKYNRILEYKNTFYRPNMFELFQYSDWLSEYYIDNEEEILKLYYWDNL